ncbi:MAG TPA: nucleotide exchange factor GrpE [Acidimicrobiales bacterium]|nr:nucleotide exchange factor GrpE [Acidimicrobiales bacterium]
MTDHQPSEAEEELEPAADDEDDVEAAAEVLEADIASIAAQRDEYLALAQRLQAEFENYKKQTVRRNTEVIEHAGAQLATKLLPVLDAFDSAIIQGVEGISPIHKALFDALQKEGLEVIDTDGVVFDPNLHEAVMHEEADADDAEPMVSETLRTGYLWKGRVMRPAMVKVRG